MVGSMSSTNVLERDPVDRAFAAYFRANGHRADIPGDESGLRTDGNGLEYVVVQNIRGILAVYRVQPTGRLKSLKRWPSEIEADYH